MRALILLALILPGCVGLGGRESSVTYPDGRVYRVRCQSDGVISLKQGDVEIKVDNRGPLGTTWAAATASLGKVYDKVKGEPVDVK